MNFIPLLVSAMSIAFALSDAPPPGLSQIDQSVVARLVANCSDAWSGTRTVSMPVVFHILLPQEGVVAEWNTNTIQQRYLIVQYVAGLKRRIEVGPEPTDGIAEGPPTTWIPQTIGIWDGEA